MLTHNLMLLFLLEPPNLLPLSFGAEVMNEGAFSQLSCIVSEGDEPLHISWSFHGSNITSDLGIITTPIGNRGSMLLDSSASHRHRGVYTCTASNGAGVRTSSVELRVNGKACPGRHKKDMRLINILRNHYFHKKI